MPPLPTSSVSVHVSKEPGLDFTRKNFSYKYMTLQELLHAIQQNLSNLSSSKCTGEVSGEDGLVYYYFRSLGKKPFKDKAHLSDFQIASPLPPSLEPTSPTSLYHSSVLRISHSPVQLWLHYDIPDNFLVQLEGSKKVLLFNPEQVHLLYMSGSSSRVPSTVSADFDKAAYPKALEAYRASWTASLSSSDILYIPSCWLHAVQMEAQQTPGRPCVSANVFFVPKQFIPHADPKDVYGNKDLVPAQAAAAAMSKLVLPELKKLPWPHNSFHMRKLAAELLAEAEAADQQRQHRNQQVQPKANVSHTGQSS
eukprot:GHVS01086403.1.p1 GENE.GHVS01086403.1~~GHVS01086403.1.p1  ORF type:complete len:362 (-),score=49.08 GHVS01086403.1:364-1290(-)